VGVGTPDSTGSARVVRVNGPLVEVVGLAGVRMFDLVHVGDAGLPGEVIGIEREVATVQVYEYTGGLKPGDRANQSGSPLSVELGPGLLGGIFDGLLRDLAHTDAWLAPGTTATGLPRDRKWRFHPTVKEGDEVSEGMSLGTIAPAEDGSPVPMKALVPIGKGGTLEWLASPGQLGLDDKLAIVGGEPVSMVTKWPVRVPRPAKQRLRASVPLRTGQRVLDLLFPIARGSSAAVPGGFGTGKTMLLQQIAKWCDADVIVYVGCGERGNEMADVAAELAEMENPRTGRSLLERVVLVANTSNMPVMAREASIYMGVTVAEYFRDMGLAAVVIADSTSRWAEALREISSRMHELPAEEGFPARLASSLAAFYERAGRFVSLGGDEGSVSILGAVSPPGGDMTEPVTAHTRRFVRAVWSLDRDLAYARHYPAVSWRQSFSRDAATIGNWYVGANDPAWADRRERCLKLLAAADRLRSITELVGTSALPDEERLVLVVARILQEAVLQQNALIPNDATSSPEKTAALVQLALDIQDESQELLRQHVPVSVIEETDFSAALRARTTAPPEGAGDVKTIRDEIVTHLRGLA
jgi:V/A-type H+-transporting ATPase subunit A